MKFFLGELVNGMEKEGMLKQRKEAASPSHLSPAGKNFLNHPNLNKNQLVQTSFYYIMETEVQDRKGLS